ncbi:hypothetical protein Pcinc_003658 [Petrolisthes cinctipes]|uniref:Uncharacterized protein n=1 Tax=Petrolisthes cinctipes TaxID=88211 RepID=A0AAE1GGT4_PETCI|nr:hypothetical protein Pcinc_003658 [Petrolisthes cinctipes]
MVAICSDALLKAMSGAFSCSSAHLKGYCSICDFFLWGYLKEKVFRSRPHNLEELKMRIREEIAAIPLEMCRRAAENFRHRLQQCIATDGHHLPDAIFKK